MSAENLAAAAIAQLATGDISQLKVGQNIWVKTNDGRCELLTLCKVLEIHEEKLGDEMKFSLTVQQVPLYEQDPETAKAVYGDYEYSPFSEGK